MLCAPRWVQDRKQVEDQVRKQFPPFKATKEFEFGFKIRWALISVPAPALPYTSPPKRTERAGLGLGLGPGPQQ